MALSRLGRFAGGNHGCWLQVMRRGSESPVVIGDQQRFLCTLERLGGRRRACPSPTVNGPPPRARPHPAFRAASRLDPSRLRPARRGPAGRRVAAAQTMAGPVSPTRRGAAAAALGPASEPAAKLRRVRLAAAAPDRLRMIRSPGPAPGPWVRGGPRSSESGEAAGIRASPTRSEPWAPGPRRPGAARAGTGLRLGSDASPGPVRARARSGPVGPYAPAHQVAPSARVRADGPYAERLSESSWGLRGSGSRPRTSVRVPLPSKTYQCGRDAERQAPHWHGIRVTSPGPVPDSAGATAGSLPGHHARLASIPIPKGGWVGNGVPGIMAWFSGIPGIMAWFNGIPGIMAWFNGIPGIMACRPRGGEARDGDKAREREREEGRKRERERGREGQGSDEPGRSRQVAEARPVASVAGPTRSVDGAFGDFQGRQRAAAESAETAAAAAAAGGES